MFNHDTRSGKSTPTDNCSPDLDTLSKEAEKQMLGTISHLIYKYAQYPLALE